MAVRAILFDLFDTLVDLYMENLRPVEHGGRRLSATVGRLHAVVEESRPISFDAFAEALGEVDRALFQEHYAVDRELPTTLRFEALCRHLEIADDALPGRLTDTHMGALHEQVGIPASHAGVLEALAADASLAVCSNFSHSPKAVEILEEADLARHLDAVVVSDAVGLRKPRPEIFEAALQELGVAPEETLHVGDNLSADVGGASALGIGTVWITRRVADPDAALAGFDGPRPDHSIADLGELRAIVAERGGRA